tara:strand:+ start:19793 stop:21628 length:1836 start_codon:yes stop_codon:yes gene_type:complete
MTKDLTQAIEELKTSVNQSNGILRTVQSSIAQTISVQEGLKASMIKNGSFTEGKLFSALEKVGDLPGRFDKVLANFGQFVERGLGQNTKAFMGVMGKISALGLDNTPFLMLARQMNNTMGMSLESQTKALTQLLNLRDLSEANPEILAGILASNAKVFQDKAGIYGPEWAGAFRQAAAVIGAEMGGGGEALQPIIEATDKFLDAGGEGMKLRAQLGLQADISHLDSEGIMQLIMDIPKAMKESDIFTSPMKKAFLGKSFGISNADFAILEDMNKKLPEFGAIQEKLAKSLGELSESEDIEGMLSTFMNRLVNTFEGIPRAALKIFGGDKESRQRLLNTILNLADVISNWLSSAIANQATKFMNMMTSLDEATEESKTGFEKVGEWLTSLGDTIANTVEVMSFAFNGLMRFIGQGGLKKVWEYVVLSIDSFAIALPSIFNTGITNFGIMLQNTWNALWSWTMPTLGGLIKGLIIGVWDIAVWIVKGLANIFNPLNWVSAGLDWITGGDDADPLMGGVNTMETTEIRKGINAGTIEPISQTPMIPYEERVKSSAELAVIQERDNLKLQESFTAAFDASEMNKYFKDKKNDTAFASEMWQHVKEFGIKLDERNE